jgi:hypothetical protein
LDFSGGAPLSVTGSCSCGGEFRWSSSGWLWSSCSLLLSDAGSRLPCERLPNARIWSSSCSSVRVLTRSSSRHPLPCSPLPRPAAPPHVVRPRASHSLPRYARPSASACWCRLIYRLVAWSRSPLVVSSGAVSRPPTRSTQPSTRCCGMGHRCGWSTSAGVQGLLAIGYWLLAVGCWPIGSAEYPGSYHSVIAQRNGSLADR